MIPEISKILNRNDVGLRNNYLNRLVKENKLKLIISWTNKSS